MVRQGHTVICRDGMEYLVPLFSPEGSPVASGNDPPALNTNSQVAAGVKDKFISYRIT